MRLAVALVIILAQAAAAQLVGECPPGQTALSQDGTPVGCGALDLPSVDFTCRQATGGLVCNLATSISHLSTCIGDVNGELCNPFDARPVTLLSNLITMEEGTAPASPGAGKLSIGAETGTPGRLVVTNESGQQTRLGIQVWTVTLGALAADNTTRYVPPLGSSVTPDTTEANVDTFTPPGPVHIWAIACGGLTAPTGAGKTRTFTVRSGAPGALANSSIPGCTWTDTGKTCATRLEAGLAVSAGQVVTIAASAANTPAATNAAETTCSLFWNLDAF